MSHSHPVKQWFLTYSRCDGEKEDLLHHLQSLGGGVVEHCIARELHELAPTSPLSLPVSAPRRDDPDSLEGATLHHLHVYVKFRVGVKPRDVLVFQFDGRTAFAQRVRSVQAVLKYVRKDGDFITNIANLLTYKGDKVRKTNMDIIEMGALAAVEEGLVRLVDVRKIEQGIAWYKSEKNPAVEQDDCRGVWIYGESGAGKTRAARRDFPGFFPKAVSKWWDGYCGEQFVLLDDLRKDQVKYIVWFLTQWMDRYVPPRGEKKGNTTNLCHHRFIVTSQWSIEEIFDEPKDASAIRRRCAGRIFHLHGHNLGKENEPPCVNGEVDVVAECSQAAQRMLDSQGYPIF